MTTAQELSRRFAGQPPAAILAAALEAFPDAALACSLGLEDVALVHLASQLPRPPRIFVLDTGRLPPETYDVLAALRHRYQLPIQVYFPRADAVEAFVNIPSAKASSCARPAAGSARWSPWPGP